MTNQWLSAGSKLNLCLHINHRRDDGYHELQSLFQLLDYGDRIKLIPLDSIDMRIEVQWQAGDQARFQVPPLETDLIFKAALCLQTQASGQPLPGVRVILEKNTPIGGGIGGGSAVAACVLKALNHYWNLNLSVSALEQLGLSLGADVPFFVKARSAMVDGVGEHIRPCSLPETYYLVIVPQQPVRTASLFADPALTRDTPKQPSTALISQWQQLGRNDFQPVVFHRYPAINKIAVALKNLSGFARLTGTGGCVFAPAPSAAQAEEWGDQLLAQTDGGQRYFIARGVNAIDAVV